MDIEIAKMERMSQTGSSLLRLIQNSHTPALDLLAREAIQNSLDAAAYDDIPVKFDMSIHRFKNEKVSKHFKGIDKKLMERFSSIGEAIVLRDSNTVGLTGPIHQDNVVDNNFGNLLKLIYEISMPQEKKEAGGSWGLGKTVYFRIGIGLVVYYSQIKLENGSYESRLAACLVEDESKDDALIPLQGKNKRGIAWWGKLHNSSSTKPITNEKFIKSFLSDFGIKPFSEGETGTMVIIPYIDEEKLLVKPEINEELNASSLYPWWYSAIEKYLVVAIQRWYAPRIDNPSYKKGNYLLPSVNKTSITKNKMEPMFRVVRGLYNYSEENEKDDFIDNENLRLENIVVHRDMESNIAGKIAFIKVSRKELQMIPPYNKYSPYEHIDEHSYSEADSNAPIICYVRKPGMIINYEIDSKWTQGIEKTDREEYIIGVFVPDSNNKVKLPDISLDEYLRQGEKADHSSWEDTNYKDKRFTIVERIQKRVAQAIKEAFNKEDEKFEGTRSSALSAKLASSLLPPVGFGNASSLPSKKSINNDVKKGRNKGSFEIMDSIKVDGELIVSVEIIPSKIYSTGMIELLIESEGNRKIRGNSWESDIGTKFPLEIKSATISSEKQVEMHVIKTKEHSINHKLSINLLNCKSPINIDIIIQVTDEFIQPNILYSISNEVVEVE